MKLVSKKDIWSLSNVYKDKFLEYLEVNVDF